MKRMSLGDESRKAYSLTDQDIDDIMCSALEGGITYWAASAVVAEEFKGEYASDQISRGGSLIITEREDGSKYDLTKEKFIAGFDKWYKEGGDFYDAVQEDGSVDCGLIDAERADAIVQYALFDKLVYG